MGYGKKARGAKERATKSFMERYGMTRKEWSIFKKESPQEAHKKRLKVQNPVVR
jgi:hypothetical protein